MKLFQFIQIYRILTTVSPLQKRVWLIITVLLLQTACNPNRIRTPDPLQSFNRSIYQFNRQVDKVLLKPLAQAYRRVPQPVRQGTHNVISNLNDVSVIGNDLLQGKLKQAGQDTGRFLLNSSVGFLGIVDIATPYGLPKHHEDFGQTLGAWGVPSGPYLMLPFLGPSTLRDTVALGVDLQMDSRRHISNHYSKPSIYYGGRGLEVLDIRQDLLDKEELLDAAAMDEYEFIRNAHIQRREAAVQDGNIESSVEDDELFGDL